MRVPTSCLRYTRVKWFSSRKGISPSFDFDFNFCVVDPFKKRSQDVFETFFAKKVTKLIVLMFIESLFWKVKHLPATTLNIQWIFTFVSGGNDFLVSFFGCKRGESNEKTDLPFFFHTAFFELCAVENVKRGQLK